MRRRPLGISRNHHRVLERLSQVPVDGIDDVMQRLRLPPPPAVIDAMRASLERHGQLAPVVVREAPDRPVLIDGFKRLRAARAIGRAQLTARTLPLSDEAAIAAVYSLNRAACCLTDLEEAFVVRALCREQSLEQYEVAALMGHHPSWVSRRLALAERLSESLQQDLRVGLLSATAAREIARVPRGTQPRLAACAHRHRLSTREVADLVTLWETTPNEDDRKQLLAEPRSRLPQRAATAPQHARPVGVSTEVDRVTQLILRSSEAMTRLYREAKSMRADSFAKPERLHVRPAVRQLASVVDAARPLLCAWVDLLEDRDESNAS